VRNLQPVAIAWLFTIAWSASPYLVATMESPPGTRFVGAFYYVDDFYNYLSYAQQAEEGAFFFRNKVLLDDHSPALVNLEWSFVGSLGRLLGGRLLLAYRIFGLLAAALMLVGFDRWLVRLGLPSSHRLPALLLLTTGGGLGGLLFRLGSRPLYRCLDLFAGLFPSLCLLVNPHFVAGTALLAVALLCYEDQSGPRAWARATLVATALALVRPYDFVLLVLIRTTAVLILEPVRHWPKALLPMAGLLPVVAYLYWLFYLNPAFAFYARTAYAFPATSDFAWALAPAALLGLTAWARTVPSPKERRALVYLAVWAAFGLVVIVARPVHFSLQFLVGIGFPLLALGAVGLARLPAPLTLATAAAFSTTLLVAFRFVLAPSPLWLTPRENMEIVAALKPECRAGDIVMAPLPIGLFAAGLTPCRAFLSHPIAPDYEARFEEFQRFLAGSPAARLAILERAHVSHLVLPGDPGPTPVAWLGPDSPFVQTTKIGASLSLYMRRPAD
jgi:hypothetical protein